MAGGLKFGHIHGSTDEFGHRAIEDIVTQHDFHATLLHQLGIDHEVLHHEVNDRPIALVEAGKGQVVEGILA